MPAILDRALPCPTPTYPDAQGPSLVAGQALGQLHGEVPANNLQRAMDIARLAELRHSLHNRLGAAPPREQRRQAEILEQYRIHTLHGRDYLYELDSLRQHVENRLNDMLVDYSTYATGVEIVPRLALAGRRQSLLDFAMGPTSAQAPEFDVVSLATGLTQTVVRQMLTQLNIQSDYHTYLNQNCRRAQPVSNSACRISASSCPGNCCNTPMPSSCKSACQM